MIHHKTCIPRIPAFVYLVCFYSQTILPSNNFQGIISVQFSALHYFIFSVYTYLNFNRMFSSTFQICLQIFNKTILQSDIFTAIFQHLLSFLGKWSQLF